MRARTSSTGTVAAAAIAVFAALSTAWRADPPIEPLIVSRETTWITEPLRSDGMPDYAAWLTRRYGTGVTSDNNAASALLELRMHGLGDSAALEQALKDGGAAPPADFKAAFVPQFQRALRAPWTEADAPLIAAWLRLEQPSLARLEEIVRTHPRYWLAPPDDMGFDMRIPSRLALRHASFALRARTLRQATLDATAARRDTVLGLRLAALVSQGPSFIDRLMSAAVIGTAMEPVVALANPPSERSAAAALLAEVRDAPAAPPLEEMLDVQRLELLGGYLDLYRSGRRSPNAWEPRVSAVLYGGWLESAGEKAKIRNLRRIPAWAIDWNELFRQINACGAADCRADVDAAAAQLESPAFDQLLERARSEPAARRTMARAFLRQNTPTTLQVSRDVWSDQQAIRRMALVSAAAALWRVDHGRYPESAAAIASGPNSAGFDPTSDHADYTFRYAASSDGQRFAYTAKSHPRWGWPGRAGTTWARSLCADSSGRLISSNCDPALTICPPALKDGVCPPGNGTVVSREP